MKNPCKEKIKACQPTFGIWVQFPSAELVEFMGHLGFDWVLFDAEHFAFNMETIQSMVRAAQLTGMTPMVRVRKNDPELILAYLETGVLGIEVPHVNTAEEARAAVRAVKYGPMGKRGAGSMARAANYGLTQTSREYVEEADRQTMVITLIEEEEGYSNLPEILRVEGVDIIDFGPGDLSMSMGLIGQSTHPRVVEVVEKAKTQIRTSDKVFGATVKNAEAAEKAMSEGALWIEFDLKGALSQSARDFLKGVHR